MLTKLQKEALNKAIEPVSIYFRQTFLDMLVWLAEQDSGFSDRLFYLVKQGVTFSELDSSETSHAHGDIMLGYTVYDQAASSIVIYLRDINLLTISLKNLEENVYSFFVSTLRHEVRHAEQFIKLYLDSYHARGEMREALSEVQSYMNAWMNVWSCFKQGGKLNNRAFSAVARQVEKSPLRRLYGAGGQALQKQPHSAIYHHISSLSPSEIERWNNLPRDTRVVLQEIYFLSNHGINCVPKTDPYASFLYDCFNRNQFDCPNAYETFNTGSREPVLNMRMELDAAIAESSINDRNFSTEISKDDLSSLCTIDDSIREENTPNLTVSIGSAFGRSFLFSVVNELIEFGLKKSGINGWKKLFLKQAMQTTLYVMLGASWGEVCLTKLFSLAIGYVADQCQLEDGVLDSLVLSMSGTAFLLSGSPKETSRVLASLTGTAVGLNCTLFSLDALGFHTDRNEPKGNQKQHRL